jgi:uncharacterized membrane protein YfcA
MQALDLGSLVTANVVMAVACALQSVVGFGSALIAAPLLALLDPSFVPGPMLVAGFVLSLAMTLRERHAIDRAGLAYAIAGRVPGSFVGAKVLASVSQALSASLFSGLILLGVGLTLFSSRVPKLSPSPKTSFVAGAISGVMGTVTSAGGPPLALLYQHESGPTLRGTLASYFLLGSLVSIAALLLVGEVGRAELERGLSLVPGLLLGFVSTRNLHTSLDRGHTRKAVLAVSAFSAMLVLLKEALG